MSTEAELPAGTKWGEPSLPVKGPLNDFLAHRMVKEAQGKMEKSMSEPKKSKNISVPEQDIPPVDDLSYSLVKLYFKVNTSSRDDEDDYDPYLLQRDYFPELLWAFSMTYMGNHFPNKAEDLPEGVKPAPPPNPSRTASKRLSITSMASSSTAGAKTASSSYTRIST